MYLKWFESCDRWHLYHCPPISRPFNHRCHVAEDLNIHLFHLVTSVRGTHSSDSEYLCSLSPKSYICMYVCLYVYYIYIYQYTSQHPVTPVVDHHWPHLQDHSWKELYLISGPTYWSHQILCLKRLEKFWPHTHSLAVYPKWCFSQF